MLQRTVIANGYTFTVVDDATLVYRVLAHGQVRDAISGRTLAQPFFITLNRKDIAVKTMSDGLFCLAGYAERVFPDHAVQAYAVLATFSAQGYADHTMTLNVPAAVPYPTIAPPVDLRPQPVVLTGRVTDNTGAPIVGALVTAQDSAAQHALILRKPLASRYGVGAAVTAIPPSGVTRNLIQIADEGEAVLVLDDVLAAVKVNVTDGVNTDQVDVGALSNVDGFYQARGMGGVARLTLRCDKAPKNKTADYGVDYSHVVNRVDFVL